MYILRVPASGVKGNTPPSPPALVPRGEREKERAALGSRAASRSTARLEPGTSRSDYRAIS